MENSNTESIFSGSMIQGLVRILAVFLKAPVTKTIDILIFFLLVQWMILSIIRTENKGNLRDRGLLRLDSVRDQILILTTSQIKYIRDVCWHFG